METEGVPVSFQSAAEQESTLECLQGEWWSPFLRESQGAPSLLHGRSVLVRWVWWGVPDRTEGNFDANRPLPACITTELGQRLGTQSIAVLCSNCQHWLRAAHCEVTLPTWQECPQWWELQQGWSWTTCCCTHSEGSCIPNRQLQGWPAPSRQRQAVGIAGPASFRGHR